MKKIFTILFSFLIYSSLLFSQVEVSSRLQQAISEANPEDYIKVLVLLRDQVDVVAMDEQFYMESVSIPQRVSELIITLKEKAATTQVNLLSYIEEKTQSGEVFRYESFWIANLVMVEAKVEVINEIMFRLDVSQMDLDAILELDKPVEVYHETEGTESLEPGLKIVNAHLLWAMGITGQGRLVMGIDTGVQLQHPALQYKWRGNFVPHNQAWFDPAYGTTTPNDCDYHGSHTMGTMVGRSTTSADTVGVAIDAQWIASNTLCGGGSHTSRSIAAFQWALDPDGNPSTINDMPDVISNSWYDPDVTNECSGIYKTTFDALEAAGIAVVFSAGNAGPGVSTITKPKNINTNDVNVFCVANINGSLWLGGSNDPISNSSSRGPSVCGGTGSLLIKPEVSAPGTSVRSCNSSGGYTSASGTSMAAPHVAGAVALLKQAFPNLTGRQILEALYNTARDLGTVGEDNTYGKGLIDVYAAFLSLGTPDLTPPDPIVNLSVIEPTSNSLNLQWTVPYDSSTNGVTNYDIRYSLLPIIDENTFNNATPLTFIGTPGVYGSTETFNVPGLNFATIYHFSIKSSDMWGNWSNISNQASGTTWIAPQIDVNPLSINQLLAPQSTVTDTINISNITALSSTLDFTVSLENNTFPAGLIEVKLIPKSFEEVLKESNVDKENQVGNNGISIDGQGGPDLFGYKWIDSNDPNGPQYSWYNVTTNPSAVQVTFPNGNLDDGWTNAIPIGFSFDFYGNQYNNLYLSTNGFLSFNALSSSYLTNATIPATGLPNNIIAPFWDDLDGRTQGTVHYLLDNDKFYIQFTNWQKYNATGSLTFQVVLYSNGRIMIYYNNMNATLTSATVGIENSTGTVGLQIAYNAAYVANGLAVKISADPDWISNDISSGRIYSGNTIDVILTFNSEDYPLGTYTMDVVINSNDPMNNVITIPVSMQIANIFELTSLIALLEGFYDGTTMVSDSVNVQLRNTTAPYSLVDQTKIFLNGNGQGSASFTNASNGIPYYIVLKHRNAVETWSALPQTFTANSLTYDFTTGVNKAYGNNLKLIGSKWCIYGGDVNQDGFVETADVNLVFTDNVNGSTGYVASDLNGDMLTEIEDLNIVFTNSVLGVESKAPSGYVSSKEETNIRQTNR
ncbi:MAG TPA: S8 family serine peptidase [Ignavibacteriaceae bacterium]|nr:S8 family serine peptidase [Ignavibacteriaceae bacterium]